MPVNFPDSPTVGQTYTVDGRTWVWTGTTWDSLSGYSIGPTGPTGATGPTGPGITGLTATVEELNYVDGVTSSIQTQLNNKAKLNIYSLPQTGATQQWINLGTLSASQDGHSLLIKIVSKQGYNASTVQSQYTTLNFKTANGGSFIAGSTGNFYGDALARVDALLGPNNSTPGQIRIQQNSTTSYTVFGLFDPYSGLGSFYEVSNSAGSTWTNSSTLTTAPTGNYIVVPMVTETAISDISANYTLVTGDRSRTIRSTGSAVTVTIPDILLPGDRIDFLQDGAGQITFSPSGVTLQSVDNKRKTNKQYSGATLLCVAAGQYRLIGDLAA